MLTLVHRVRKTQNSAGAYGGRAQRCPCRRKRVLARQLVDAAFLSMQGKEPSTLGQGCCDLIGRLGRRPLVVLLDESQTGCAGTVRKAGSAFVYVKRPIWRTGFIRRQTQRAEWDVTLRRAQDGRTARRRIVPLSDTSPGRKPRESVGMSPSS